MVTRAAGKDWGGKLHAAVAKIKRAGTFCTSGTAPGVHAGLEVEGLGLIGLPLSAGQAKRLRRLGEQAPFGKGTQTLVDTDVRRVWRLRPDRFALTNPDWPAALRAVVKDVERDLGLEAQKLQPHLYELLLYEKGSFFLPHQDGEKIDRMVATLVIALPSSHAGGELVVRHEEREVTVDFGGGKAAFETRYAAFYADCEHEVKPLREGFRLCLVYNLTLSKPAGPVGAPRQGEHVRRIAEVLRGWSASDGDPRKLAVALEHQYTKSGLAWDALKGVDAARARALAEAAREAGCHAHLALLTFWESGAAEYAGGEPAGYRRRGRSSRYGDDDDEDPNAMEMGEVFDSSRTAEHWLSPAGDRPAFGSLPLKGDEIVPEDALTSVTPEEDVSGYTGNEGLTMQRWYRRAAVVLWPDARHFDVLCSAGARQAVPALRRMTATLRSAAPEDAAAHRARCLTFARAVLDHWPEEAYRRRQRWDGTEPAAPVDPLPALERLNDPPLIGDYLRKVLARDATMDPGQGIVRATSRHGWLRFRPDLIALVKASTGETIERNVRLVDRLCRAAVVKGGVGSTGEGTDADALEVARALPSAAVAALVRIDTTAKDAWCAERRDRAITVARLGRAILVTGQDELLARLVTHVSGLPTQYTLHDAHVPAVTKLTGWAAKHLKNRSPALSKWLADCIAQLEALTATAPEPEDDRRDDAVRCGCKDCAELKRFLSDPGRRQHAFQMAQSRRSHLENNIRSAKCDLDCDTDKRPRPQVLVCVKNTASHDRRVAEYQKNLKRLAILRSLRANLGTRA